MNNKTILIAGGAGYIGSHAAKELTRRGYDVIIFDNLVYGHREFIKWGSFILGDLADKDLLDLIFKKYHIDAVMHFSAFTYVGESVTEPSKYYVNNVSNTVNLLNAMKDNGVKHFIFSSTCATYGNPIEIPITESHPQSPINPYGMSKLMVEKILADYSKAYDLKYAALRYFNASGADPDNEIGEWHDPETHLIPLILDAAIGIGKNVKVFGKNYDTEDGTCIRDYIHVTDLADAHIRTLEYLQGGGEPSVFNLGNGSGYSVSEVINAAEAVTKKKIEVEDAPRREGDPPVLIGNAKKAIEVLGWKTKYASIDDIVKTAWEWHKKLNKEIKSKKGLFTPF
jgi:UDP-glucose 4-epimerase